MSKVKNRCIRNIPQEYQNHYKSEYFDKNKKIDKTSPTLTPESDIDSITLDLNKLGGLSSSSSLSWSDEYENDTTKKIYQELRRVDRVLRGEEPIPSEYDKDEFEQWMTFFPKISIFDHDRTPVNSTHDIFENLKEEEESFLTTGSHKQTFFKEDCDNLTFNKNNQTLSVINLNDHPSNRLLVQRSASSRKRAVDERKNRNIFTISNKPRSLDTERYLKISSIRNRVNDRKSSSMNRQISKEYSESTLEFNSLPFIEVEEIPVSNRKLTVQNRKNSRPDISHRRNNRLILPPIASDQFRSVSATPRQAYKTFSAVSVKSNFIPLSTRKSSISFLEGTVRTNMKENGFV